MFAAADNNNIIATVLHTTYTMSCTRITIIICFLDLFITAVLFLAHGGSCGEQGLTPQLTDQCLCPGQQLQLLCTAVGLGTTVWSGTAFPSGCASLLLPHTRFSNPGGETRSCPPDITAASVSVDGDCYTSRLNVTVRSNQNGNNVTCVHDNGTVPFLIDTYNIAVTTGWYNWKHTWFKLFIFFTVLRGAWPIIAIYCVHNYYLIASIFKYFLLPLTTICC